MAKFRVRCIKCAENFCSSCKEYPYHIGKTCEQFKEFKNSRKCRFCGIKIPPGSKLQSDKPAFRDVCSGEECIQLMKKSCDKIHPCGHLCNGFNKEKKCLPCLNEKCASQNRELMMGQDQYSYCLICGCE